MVFSRAVIGVEPEQTIMQDQIVPISKCFSFFIVVIVHAGISRWVCIIRGPGVDGCRSHDRGVVAGGVRRSRVVPLFRFPFVRKHPPVLGAECNKMQIRVISDRADCHKMVSFVGPFRTSGLRKEIMRETLGYISRFKMQEKI